MPSSGPRFGTFTTDIRLVVRSWDPYVESITGIAVADAVGRPLAALLADAESRGLLDAITQTATSGAVQVLAPALHRGASGEGGTRALNRQRITVGPLRDDGRIVGVAVTVDGSRDASTGHAHADDLAATLADARFRTRQQAVRELAGRGRDIVDTVVATLRAQHRDFNVLSSLLDLVASADIDIVEPLTACLADDDVNLRIQAALILGERRDRRAIPGLIGALGDPDVNVRFHAIDALGVLEATAAADRLATIAGEGDFFLAFPAVQALTRIGDVSVAPRLVPLLGDEMLRAVVAEALGTLGDELVAPPLVALLNQADGPTEVVADALAGLYERYEHRYHAGEHIASLVRRAISPTGTQNLLDAVARASADRLRGIARVMGWLTSQAVQRSLTRLLAQRAVRAQVVEALVRYGAGVVDLLIEQLAAEDLDTRQAAAVALGRIGDRRATAALLAALDDGEMALPVAGALARLGDPAAFERLLSLLGHEDAGARQAAIAALNSIGHAEMPERIATLLDDANPVLRESAVKVAGYFGYPTCVDRVLRCCDDPSEAVRRAAVEHLPFFDHPHAVDRLARALDADAPPVRAAAASALARTPAAAAIPLLSKALHDADPWVRYFAVRSLGSFQQADVAEDVGRLIGIEPTGHVRLAAIDALGRLNPAGAGATLEALTASPDADIACAAIRALGHTTDAHAAPVLERLVRAPDAARRVEAVGAIGIRGGRTAPATLQWVAAAEDDRDVAAAAIASLARLAANGDGEATAATAALIALAAEPARRDAVIAALAGLPAVRLADVAHGLRHPSTDVRRAIVDVLSRMKNPEASRLLEEALSDAEPAVRAAAVGELRRLGSRQAARKLLVLARTDPDFDVRQAAVMAVTYQRPNTTAEPAGESR